MWGILAVLITLIMAACGGGNGEVTTPIRPRTDLKFGYFETVDGQIAATASSVNFVHCQDDSDPDNPASRAWREAQIIACLQQAQAYGIQAAVVSIGFLLFTSKFEYRGTIYLAPFLAQLRLLGLDPLIQWFYPMDEPDGHGISDGTMTQAIADIRKLWPQAKIAIVYGTTGNTPGIDSADLIGRDDYSAGTGVFNELPSIRPDQSYIILPGGANPWRQNPQPFLDYANATPQVAMIWTFLYGTYTDQHGIEQGIGTNGMLPQYQTIGCKVTGKC
jgi:hypothetical protein